VRWVIVAAGLAPAPAWAISCSIASTTAVSFGNYSVYSGADAGANGAVELLCTGVAGATVTVELDKGASASFSPRTLVLGGDTLNYDLFLDAAHTTVWGDGTGGTSVMGPLVPFDGSTTYLTVYGVLYKLQDAAVGTYTDTVTATVVF
jgi:spore coat protein U-like protein